MNISLAATTTFLSWLKDSEQGHKTFSPQASLVQLQQCVLALSKGREETLIIAWKQEASVSLDTKSFTDCFWNCSNTAQENKTFHLHTFT